MGAEQEYVCVSSSDHGRGFDVGTIRGLEVHNRGRTALFADAVCSDLLDDDGRVDDGSIAVVANASIAHGIAVDLVGYVPGAVCITEARGINGTALIDRAVPWIRRWVVRTFDIGASSCADAVVVAIATSIGSGTEIHHECSIVLLICQSGFKH